MVAFLFALLQISSIISTSSSTPLPTCQMGSIPNPLNYLLPKALMLECGLPSSRLYLLSKFNAILTIDQDNLSPINAQSKTTILVNVCQPPPTLTNLWFDDISIRDITPWNIETCNQAELNLYARLVTKNRFQAASIRSLHLADRCAFAIDFTAIAPGIFYHINMYVHTHVTLTHCKFQGNTAWR